MATSKKRPEKNKQVTTAKQDKLTLKYWLIGILAVAAVVGAVFLLSYLTPQPDTAVPFTVSGDDLIRDSDGARYVKAPAMYQVDAFYKKSEPRYGKAGNLSIYKVGYKDTQYNTIVALDEAYYLTDGKGNLYYNPVAVSLPNLETFKAEQVSMGTMVTTDKGTTITYLKTLTNKNSPDASDFVAEYLDYNPYLGEGLPQETCQLKLTSSSKYPYLSYMMYLVRCDNGDFYVYTEADRSGYQVSSKWFEEIWKSETTTAAPTTTVTPETTKTPTASDTPDTTK